MKFYDPSTKPPPYLILTYSLSVYGCYGTERDIANGINVVQHKYSEDPIFKRKPL